MVNYQWKRLWWYFRFCNLEKHCLQIKINIVKETRYTTFHITLYYCPTRFCRTFSVYGYKLQVQRNRLLFFYFTIITTYLIHSIRHISFCTQKCRYSSLTPLNSPQNSIFKSYNCNSLHNGFSSINLMYFNTSCLNLNKLGASTLFALFFQLLN